MVEVRHRTMWIADRSWTRRTRTRQESEAEGRSGRQAEGRSGRQAGRRQEATLIKSNNPHLAGGEKIENIEKKKIKKYLCGRASGASFATTHFPIKQREMLPFFLFLLECFGMF